MTTFSMEFDSACFDSADKDGMQRSSQAPIVLAIDDDYDNLVLLGCALEILNCEFIGETSGKAALVMAQERQPALILLDVILPDIHGIDFVHLLKQDQRTAHIPVIAVTGLATWEDREQLLAAGFAEYMSKPYMVEDLETLVSRYLPVDR
ncbi:MAG: response regulator [Elainella sp. Prado103]|nr:response regulator [Elainella sp. Prado103]